jgi:tripartite-type tricarboxylate transporter receptor subunit TctC
MRREWRLLPRPACGERVGVRGPLRDSELTDLAFSAQARGGAPSPGAQTRVDLSPHAGRGAYTSGRRWPRIATRAAIVLVALLAAPLASAQNAVENFYRGKTVTILIGHPAGGSYDLYARLAAAHLGKYIPGHPQVLVQTKQGGAGAGALQFLYSYGPKDGTLLGLFPETIALTQLTQPEIGKWKVQDLVYLGSFANVNAVFMVRKDSPAKTIDEMRRVETKVGCSSRLSQSYANPSILKTYGGFKFKIICGYPGSMEFPMVLARGEVDLISSSWNAWRLRSDVADGTLRPVIQSGLVRHKELPDVPLMQELLTDPNQKQLVEFLSSGSAVGRALLVHGATPPERIAALRSAFDQLVKDPEFIAQAERAGAELDPTPGVEIQKLSAAIVATPKDIVDMAAAAEK